MREARKSSGVTFPSPPDRRSRAGCQGGDKGRDDPFYGCGLKCGLDNPLHLPYLSLAADSFIDRLTRHKGGSLTYAEY